MRSSLRATRASPRRDLKRFCADNLSDYKVPDSIAFLPDALPRNANGKVQKTALRDTVPLPLRPGNA